MAVNCTTVEALNHLQNNICNWLDEGIKVHFLYTSHMSVNCHPNFSLLVQGQHPSIKVIFISPHIENEANAMIQLYNETHAHQDPEATEVGSRKCPVCNHE